MKRLSVIVIVGLISAVFFCEDTLVTMLIPILPSITILTSSNETACNTSVTTTVSWNSTSTTSTTSTTPSTSCRLHYSQLGVLFGLQGLVQLIFNPLSGLFIDCTRPVYAMLVGYLLNVASCCTFSLAHDFYLLIVAVCFNSLGGSFHICGSIAFLAEIFTQANQRRKYIGIIHVFLFIGSSVGPFYGGFLFQYCGQVIPFLLLVPVFVGCTVSFTLFHWVQCCRERSPKHPVRSNPTPEKRKKSEDELMCSSVMLASRGHLNVMPNVKGDDEDLIFAVNSKFDGLKEVDASVIAPLATASEVAIDGTCILPSLVDSPTDSSESPSVPKKPTPLWKLLKDPYILVCAGGLSVVHVGSLTLGPTLSLWMKEQYDSNETQQGAVWLSGLFLHSLGTFLGAWSCSRFPKKRAIFSMLAIFLSGVGSLLVAFMPKWYFITLPVGLQFFCIGFIEVVLIPLLTQLVDTRHTPVYGSISAIAFGSYSLTACVCGFVAGPIAEVFGFLWLNVAVFGLTTLYSPVLLLTRKY